MRLTAEAKGRPQVNTSSVVSSLGRRSITVSEAARALPSISKTMATTGTFWRVRGESFLPLTDTLGKGSVSRRGAPREIEAVSPEIHCHSGSSKNWKKAVLTSVLPEGMPPSKTGKDALAGMSVRPRRSATRRFLPSYTRMV